MKKLVKKQTGGPIKDSTAIYKKEMSDAYTSAARNMTNPKQRDSAFARAEKAGKDMDRQSKKGKTGYDATGFPLKKKQDGGVKPDLKKAMQDSAAARKFIKNNKYSGDVLQSTVEKKLALMHKPYEIRKAANDSAGIKTKPYKDVTTGAYWNKKTGGAVKTKTKTKK
jgi:hypothetical protein